MSDLSFKFPVKTAVWHRQEGRCALCGDDLVPNTLCHQYHHVVPKQMGRPSEAADAWMATADNCVALHDECHLHEAHRGHTSTFSAAPASFPYSHGSRAADHGAWLVRIEPRFWSQPAAVPTGPV